MELAFRGQRNVSVLERSGARRESALGNASELSILHGSQYLSFFGSAAKVFDGSVEHSIFFDTSH